MCKENYKIYMRLFALSSYFLTKESYDWWITRRKWGFKQQISEEKKSKSVDRKYLEALRRISQHARWAVKFPKLKVPISQPKADFAVITL